MLRCTHQLYVILRITIFVYVTTVHTKNIYFYLNKLKLFYYSPVFINMDLKNNYLQCM